METADLKVLAGAVEALENPTWAARIVNLVGMPIEAATKLLPRSAGALVSRGTTAAIRKALVTAVTTMGKRSHGAPSLWLHRAAVAGSGGVGGFFGLPGLAVELPVSTVLMLRSIADIARSEGEDLADVEARLACLQVFALGGANSADDGADTAYYATRLGLARALGEAAEHIAARGLADEGAPVIARLVARIAARFDVVVSEKVAAQAVPVVGAATRAAINLLFVTSFQRTAAGHFAVRRLERAHGADTVRAAYEAIAGRARRRTPAMPPR
jgi:hypothetical protein